MVDYKKQGKKNKAMGADFERRTRKDLQEKGWIVDKWSSNVEFWDGKAEPHTAKLIPCKHTFRGSGIPMAIGTGFPDFFAYKENVMQDIIPVENTILPVSYSIGYDIIFVECKCNGTLSAVEKEKARWYLDNNYCSKFLIAFKTKVKGRVVVNYKEFK